MLNNLLIYRFLVFNILMVLGSLAFVKMGIGHDAFMLDASYITWAIFGLFFLTWASTGVHVYKVSKAMNLVKNRNPEGPRLLSNRYAKIAHISDCAGWMVTLGLLGTVYGFLVALSGVSIEQAANVTGVQKLVSHMISGVQIALYTTLVGGFFGLWTEINFRMLRTVVEIQGFRS